jgi:HEAT repeat protein
VVLTFLIAVLASLALPAQEQKVDDAKIRMLIELLGADFLEEREPARKTLEQLGKAAEPHLVEALSHADHRVRRSCLELLIPLKTTGALKRASDLFALDEDPTVRDAAFRLLQALGIHAEEAIIGALASPAAEVRRGAIQSLSEFKSQKCVGKIAELYDRETEKTVKDAAWKCLLSMGKPAEPYLLKFLQDPDPLIRKEAIDGLRGSQDDATLAAVAKLFGQETEEIPLHKAMEFLQRAGLRAEPAFLSGLASPRPPTQKKSIDGLKTIKSEKALEPVAQIFLGECPSEVRIASAEYLKSQGLRAEGALIRGLESKDGVVRNTSIETLGEIGSEKALGAISRLFREEKDKEVHKKSFEFLKRLGIRAESDLLGALTDEDKDIRKEAVIALGDARSLRAIPRLIEFMTELDPAMKEASEVALSAIGPRAIEEVAKAVAAGKLRKQVAESIEAYYTRGEVERLLETQLGEDLSTGFYDDQFKDLAAFGMDKAMPVLIQIMNERSYVFRRAHRHDRANVFGERMRELAVMAAGELRGEGALAAVKTFAGDEIQARSLRIREETLVALHRLGEKAPLEEYLRDARRDADAAFKGTTADQKFKGTYQLFSLGLLYHRLKRYDDAIGVYLERLRVIEDEKIDKARDEWFFTTLYNLACEYSLTGDRARALEWLGKAVRAGYQDREWMKKDKDLDPIRGEEAYQKLMADDSLFEKKPGEGPPGDK